VFCCAACSARLVPAPVRGNQAGHDTPSSASAAKASDRGAALYGNYQRTGDVQLLQTVITHFREAVAVAPLDHAARPKYLSNLGAALLIRFDRTGHLADLDQAITWLSEAVAAAPAGHPGRPLYLSNLGLALRNRFGRTGQQADLDQAIITGQRAIDTALIDDPGRPMYLSNLGDARRTRFEHTGQQADLDQAITGLREAVDTVLAGHPDQPIYLSNLGNALLTRFERTGQIADLDQAITGLREAVVAAPAGHPDQSMHLSNLGNALRTRFGRTGQQADLDQAIVTGQQAVDTAPADHPGRSLYLSNLAIARRTRFEHTGQQADLDQAITRLCEAVDVAPVDHPDRPAMLSNLGNALRTRFDRTGHLADLDRAIVELSEAIDITPADHTGRHGYLCNLGLVLLTRFERTGQITDLDQAITWLSEAIVTAPGDHPDQPLYLSNLGTALRYRFQRTRQHADLDRAIATSQRAVDATPADHPGRPLYLSNLGNVLRTRFERTERQADLDQAIGRHSEAVEATPADHPDRALRLVNLGIALRTRFELIGQEADLGQAVEVFGEGAGVLTASPGRRVAAARGWGECALLAGDPGSAVEGYAAAIELLPLVAWHGLDQATREHHLREWAGLASDAAAAAVAAGQPTRAVELLEAGRSMLWTQALHLRQDLAALQERAPGLAAQLEASRTVLNTSSTSVARSLDTADNAEQVLTAVQQMLEERRQAARVWDAAVDQARQIEGFEHFLRPVPFTGLRAAATHGAVVIVNISQHGSHALIVAPATRPDTDPTVLAVDLPAAPIGRVIDQADALLGARRRTGDPATDWQTKEGGRHAVFNILAWSWQAIAEPVLTALGHTHTPPGRIEDWPRVWWCPTGPATVLPLHAAGRHPRTTTQYKAMAGQDAYASTVAGRVISSYTPTLAALTQARTRPAPGPVRQLVVGIPEAPDYAAGASSLPAVPAELQVVAHYLRAPEHATHLLGPTATRQAVLEALAGHSWLHLSCHGIQHPADPSLSAFLLHDQPLTLADLATLDLPETDLAYLAACQTATGDRRLLDEALHLAGALQLVGYRHVLATLWSISDSDAPAMAYITYAHLLHPDPDRPDRPQAAQAPYALHHAVTRLRQACPGEPLLWAPYIHLGP
jgi:hypothetical protein